MSSSNPTVKSLSLQVNELTQKLEALTQQVAALSVPAPAPTTGEGSKKARKPRVKKERDPDAPKKPLSGFMLFCKQQREAHTGEGKLTAGLLGERWNALSDAEKAAFKVASPVATPAASDAEAEAPAAAAEKKPRKVSPQMRFQQKRRSEDDTLTAKDLKTEWAALSAEEKAEYANDAE
jgi:hypothetical protein